MAADAPRARPVGRVSGPEPATVEEQRAAMLAYTRRHGWAIIVGIEEGPHAN